MAFEGQGVRDEGYVASSNVSPLTYTTSNEVLQYSSGGLPYGTACVQDTATANPFDVTAPAAAGAKAVGIVQDYPAVGPGQAVRVRVAGICKARAAGAIAYGDTLYVADTTGRVGTAPAAASNFVVGRALEAAVAVDDLITIEVRVSDGKVAL